MSLYGHTPGSDPRPRRMQSGRPPVVAYRGKPWYGYMHAAYSAGNDRHQLARQEEWEARLREWSLSSTVDWDRPGREPSRVYIVAAATRADKRKVSRKERKETHATG